MATDYTGKQVKVGARVFFKEDIEGEGIVAAILQREGSFFGGPYFTFVVISEHEPNGYPFHRMARWSNEVNAMAVYTDRVWLD